MYPVRMNIEYMEDWKEDIKCLNPEGFLIFIIYTGFDIYDIFVKIESNSHDYIEEIMTKKFEKSITSYLQSHQS